MTEKKYVANKVLLMNPEGKVLFIKESGDGVHQQTKHWTLPGGRMDKGEKPDECLKREVFEETGIEIDPSKARPVHVDLWGVQGDVENEPIIGIFYVMPITQTEVVLSKEHSESVWVDLHKPIPDDIQEKPARALRKIQEQEGLLNSFDERVKGHAGFGLVQIFTGNGKGKTTAGLGATIRAAAVGKKVGIVYFDKGGETHYTERRVLKKNGIDFVATGRDRIDPDSGRFDFSITDEDKQEGTRGLEAVQKMFDEHYDLIVLDEINSSADLGIVLIEEVLKLIDGKPEKTELILTGRNVPSEFVEKAHLMTEMKLRKHYFYSGVKAREGLDY